MRDLQHLTIEIAIQISFLFISKIVKMKKSSLLIYSLLLCLIFSSCRQDENDRRIIIEEAPEPLVLVRTEIQGEVVDEFDNPVAFASVQVGDEWETADAEGKFKFQDAKVNKSGNSILAESDGFFDGVSHSNFAAESSSFLQVTMLQKGEALRVDPSSGEPVINPDGISITIPENTLVDKLGNDYTGEIDAFSKYIDPTGENLGTQIPGALLTKDELGNQEVLSTLGMIALELESPDGEPLNIKEGSDITVKIPIPSELLGRSPEEIPLWYYDLDDDQWYQNGMCIKDGNVYVCNISCCGVYWNCGESRPSLCLSGTVLEESLSPAEYIQVVVEDLTNNFIYWGYADINGFFCGNVPAAVPLQISLIDHCDNVVYTAEVGPFASDTQLEDIILELSIETFLIKITGTALDCNGENIDGHISFRNTGRLDVYPFIDGNIQVNLAMNCTVLSEFEIEVFNHAEQFRSETFTFTEEGDINLDVVDVCEPLDDFISLNFNGTEHWTAPTKWYKETNATSNHYVLEGLNSGGNYKLEFLDYQGIGNYTESIIFSSQNFTQDPNIPSFNILSPNITVGVNFIDDEYIIGTLTGTVTDNMGADVPLTGEFKIRK